MHFLEAVYCDPCKARVGNILEFRADVSKSAQVFCYTLSTDVWNRLYLWVNPNQHKRCFLAENYLSHLKKYYLDDSVV